MGCRARQTGGRVIPVAKGKPIYLWTDKASPDWQDFTSLISAESVSETLLGNGMSGNSLLIPLFPAVSILELLAVLVIASTAYFGVFNNFEKHLSMPRRVIKLLVVVGTLAVIGLLFSRYAFWGVIALMTIGQIILHGWYFPKKGINGLTAEPHDRYLALIQEMKGEKDKN